jgi:hypothetical protein
MGLAIATGRREPGDAGRDQALAGLGLGKLHGG